MSRFSDAIAWDGSQATLNVFVVHDAGRRVPVSVPAGLTQPVELTYYPLEEDPDEAVLGDRSCSEYDVTYDDVPTDIDAVVRALLESAVDGGARAAWGAFEGSFSFDHLLTSDIAGQVYAVADASGVHLATDDDTRASADWTERVVRLGDALTH